MIVERRKSQSGFTIVEVMIVLAIAGLILAIVFIAVPALQRNSRNTQRRSDLGSLRAQFDTWTSNNGGKIPNATTGATALSAIVNSTGWGHYNGNGNTPGNLIMQRSMTPGSCDQSDTSYDTVAPGNGDGTIQQTECTRDPDGTGPLPIGLWTPGTTTPGDTPEYTIGYAFELDAGASPEFLYPDRQELHVFGGYECAKEILTGGNDTDHSGPNKYDTSDLNDSNARALAFVYQIEGEDNARCEDNV